MLEILKKQHYPHLICDCGEKDDLGFIADPSVFPLFISIPGEYVDKMYVVTSFTLN